jgi:hypothetical protein
MFINRASMWIEITIVAGFIAYLFAPALESAFNAGADLVAEHRLLTASSSHP